MNLPSRRASSAPITLMVQHVRHPERKESGRVRLPPALTPGGPHARIWAEVYPDESPENAPRRQRARGEETPLDGRDKDKSARAAVREALERANGRQDGRVPRAPE